MDNAVRQYTDLYDAHREAVCRHCAPALNRLRDEAAEALRAAELPKAGSENYEITSLAQLLQPDYGVNINRVALEVNPAASFRCGVPRLSTSLFMLVNDRFAMTPTSFNGLPKGLTVGSLNTVAAQNPAMTDGFYGALADLQNPIVALNTMLAQDGLIIHVAKGVKVAKPLQLVNILQSAVPMMAVRRLLIILEEDAEVTLLSCDHTQNPDIAMLNLQTIEIFAGENARLEFYDLEESTRLTTRLSSLYLRQERGSNVVINGITLFNGTTRNEYHTRYAGEHASLTLCGMGIEDKTRHLDTYSFVDHATGYCHTDELFKYVLDDEARGAFTGLVKVEEGAVKTEAYQSNRNIVGSDSARMMSKPQLEIYNDDVKCSHGTAIGRLDEMQLFYMRTRGIEEKDARLLLKQAFLNDVIDKVRLPQLRERLTHLVERRFTGEEASCASCASADDCTAGSYL